MARETIKAIPNRDAMRFCSKDQREKQQIKAAVRQQMIFALHITHLLHRYNSQLHPIVEARL